jgi:hypothetical protein
MQVGQPHVKNHRHLVHHNVTNTTAPAETVPDGKDCNGVLPKRVHCFAVPPYKM